ncbi:MAG TPA: acyl-CoA dehydrogenase [Egibacteraceae bacterium]|nr:acyl-CoA dehydrogenase [Egibacteraceae bacterium]
MATSASPARGLPAIDADRLQRVLDGRWAQARQDARRLLRANPTPAVHEMTVDEYREQINEHAKMIAREGHPGRLYTKAAGGEEDTGGAVTSFEMLGLSDLSLLVKAGVHWGLCGGAIFHLGTERHHAEYLPKIISYELPGCFGMTETGHGSDVQSLRTTATYDPDRDEFVIHTPDEDARKDYIGNAALHGRVCTVFAQLVTQGQSHGVHAFVVPIRDDAGNAMPGVTIEDCGHKAGLNGVDNGRLTFDQVRVPRDALLNRFGDVDERGVYSSPIENETRRFFTMLGTLVTGRISVSGAAVSATKVALTIAVRYGETRTQFAPPGADQEITLLDYLVHQRKLLPALATTYALHFAQSELVGRLHDVFGAEAKDERAQRQLESLAAGIKAATTWHATSTIQTCREACGGAGYLSENRLPQLKADTDVFTTFEGDNTVLLQLVAKGLLTDYRDEFGNLDTLGTVKFVTDKVLSVVAERTAARSLLQSLVDAVPGRDEDSDVRDRGWQLELFQWRERHVLEGVAMRLKRGADAGRDLFTIFNEAQDHVLLAARVHIDRIVLEQFLLAIESCEDPQVAAVLERLCELHALSTLERDRAWFLEHGRFTARRSKAITAAVNDLCRELRPHARLFVDAFGIPDEAIGAPIALGAEDRRQQLRRAAGDGGTDKVDAQRG